jgi:hypothetical protein
MSLNAFDTDCTCQYLQNCHRPAYKVIHLGEVEFMDDSAVLLSCVYYF